MTLGEFFDKISEDPSYVIFYFALIPVTALMASFMAKGEGNESPWKYLYTALIYLVCVPGIFALTLGIYLFLFERRSIFELNLVLQVLPILSMVITLLTIRGAANLTALPGFDKLSGLIMMISATLIIMWLIDRTHIIVFSYLRFEVVVAILIGLLIIIRLGWSRLIRGPKRVETN